MKDDSEVRINDEGADARAYLPKRGRKGSDSNRLLPVLLVVLLAVIFVAGIFYFFTRRSTKGDATLQSKMTAMEEKIADLEEKIADLQGKLGTGAPDPALLHRVEGLSQKVEALEKHSQPTTEIKAKPALAHQAVTGQKKYHTVQKGETLYRISKKYRISMEELRKLNNLSTDRPIRAGQKLLVSPGH